MSPVCRWVISFCRILAFLLSLHVCWTVYVWFWRIWVIVAYSNLIGWLEHHLASVDINGKTSIDFSGSCVWTHSFWDRDFVFKPWMKVFSVPLLISLFIFSFCPLTPPMTFSGRDSLQLESSKVLFSSPFHVVFLLTIAGISESYLLFSYVYTSVFFPAKLLHSAPSDSNHGIAI